MEISQFQFEHPTLSKISFQRNADFDFETATEMMLETSVETRIKRNGDDCAAHVELNVEICAAPPLEGPFRIEAQMEALFTWAENTIPANLVKSLLSVNAPALLLGYLRPIVANTIQYSNLPPYHIPFLDFTKGNNNEA